MCRWMAWLGQPLLIDELVFKTQHGIVDQSLHSRLGAETTNGDGFGLGWYGDGEGPAVYHSVSPAWSDTNLRELAAHIESPLFMAHVRAAIGSPVQQTNCHPFRDGRWLFVHNGFIADFHTLRRDLMLAVDPARFADIHGSTDTEVVFYLALAFGLKTSRSRRSSGRSASSRRRRASTGWTHRCRPASASRTATVCGRFATRRRVSRARCSRRATSKPFSGCIPTTRAFSGSVPAIA